MNAHSLPWFHHRTAIRGSIGALIGIYAILIILAAACPADPMPAQPGHHHHSATHKAAHTVLCAWACQASFSVLTPVSNTTTPSLRLILVVSGWLDRPAQSLHGLTQSRAPPAPLRLR
jgi:hypothetical protein